MWVGYVNQQVAFSDAKLSWVVTVAEVSLRLVQLTAVVMLQHNAIASAPCNFSNYFKRIVCVCVCTLSFVLEISDKVLLLIQPQENYFFFLFVLSMF